MADPVDETDVPADAPSDPPPVSGVALDETALPAPRERDWLAIAGRLASFAVALPLASRWYPPEYQGLAMGIAGAGNSGTLLATLFAPRLAERFGSLRPLK